MCSLSSHGSSESRKKSRRICIEIAHRTRKKVDLCVLYVMDRIVFALNILSQAYVWNFETLSFLIHKAISNSLFQNNPSSLLSEISLC